MDVFMCDFNIFIPRNIAPEKEKIPNTRIIYAESLFIEKSPPGKLLTNNQAQPTNKNAEIKMEIQQKTRVDVDML